MTNGIRQTSYLTSDRPAPEETETQLLTERIQLAAKIVIGGIIAQMIAALLVQSINRPGVIAVQAVNILAVASVLWLIRSPSQRTRNLVLMFIGYSITALCAGAVGIIAADPTTSIIVIIACAVGTSAFVPWGPWWQFAGALVSLAAAIRTVATLADHSPMFVFQNTGSVLPVLAGTVLVSLVVTRQRAQVVAVERQRNARESSLREAKSHLEQEIEEHRRTEERLRFALRELDHRVKNTLATVQFVATRTLESSRSPAEFADAFQGRIQAMSRVHTALAAQKWDGLEVRELLELVVGPYKLHDGSISVVCDEGFISSAVARMLSMTLHELATNAAKYGALSTRDGHLNISARIEAANQPRLRIEWLETNGPVVVDPTHKGLGTKLIEEGIAYEIDGVTTLEFSPSGVRCEIDIPLPRPPEA